MKFLTLLFIVFLILMSCKKDINHKPKADFTISDKIDRFELNNNSKDIDGDILTCKWVSLNNTINIINPHSSFTSFNLPELSDTEQVKIKLIVNDGHLSDSIIKNITLPKTTLARLYGLGIDLKEEHSNNVNYNWYYDQMNTGMYSLENCGPTSVTMAIKWADPNFTNTPEDARKTNHSGGGWWNSIDIINYLNLYSINNYTINITGIDSIKSQIYLGNIVILCVDMYYIRPQVLDKWHVDKFYYTNNQGWGHFIVIKGYKVVDGETYYEAYDPYSLGIIYYDNYMPKGMDRYYRSEDLNTAVLKWWNYAIIVSRSKLKSSNRGVDITKIIHKPGL